MEASGVTERNRRVALLGLVLCGVGWCAATPARADTLAEVRLRGAILADTTVGGPGETLAEWSDSNEIDDGFHVRTSGGELLSNTAKGLLQGSIYSEIQIPGSFSRASAFVQMYLRQGDTFTIGAGSSGLSNGDPVQVRIQALANTTIALAGDPSGASQLIFNVEGVPGVTGRWVDWSAGPFYAPQDLEFDEYWEIDVDTTVGSSFTLTTNLEAQIGTNSFTGPMEDVDRSDATGVAVVRVSPASGFEDLEIVSDAGAPPLPIATTPALSPIALIVLAGGMGVAGRLAVAIRRGGRRSPTRRGSRG
jgi:hypothetical protein